MKHNFMLRPFARLCMLATLSVAAGLSTSNRANGHFVWIALQDQDKLVTESPAPGSEAPASLNVYFSESATPDNPKLLDLLGKLQVWQLTAESDPRSIAVTRDGDSLVASLKGLPQSGEQDAVYIASQDFGVRTKGDETFRLMYYAKTGPVATSAVWQQVAAANVADLDVVPRVVGGKVELKIQFQGSPAADCETVILGPDDSDGVDFEGVSDADGKYAFSLTSAGRYSIRVRHVQQTPGQVGEDSYQVVRHYATLTLDVPASVVPVDSKTVSQLPTTLTSFGGAVLGDFVYIYGGTQGSSHDYAGELQNDALMRMPIAGGPWETVARGPHLQGLALVAHGQHLYRIGGFEARNRKGEEHDLWSVASVARFDPTTNQWSAMPDLPEPRSSFDAVVMGDQIYVVGGWGMAGGGRSTWHETAWKLDLSQDQPQWVAISNTPFERRALALAAHDGKLFAIGGITSGGETSLETDIYDPATDAWTAGPELVGEDGMTGFGASAFATGERLYISTVDGSLQRLASDASQWEVVGQTSPARFFHRMLPTDDQRFVLIGGSNMRGRIQAVDLITVPTCAKSVPVQATAN